jgi:hypothetical protein
MIRPNLSEMIWSTARALTVRRFGVAAVIAVGLCSAPLAAAGQQASIQGIITSSGTGGPLEGVAVVLEVAGQSEYGTLTDRNGFYQIGGIAPGTYSLRAHHLGEVEHQQGVTFAPGERLTVNFALAPDVVALEGVVVAPERGAAVRDMGRQRITPGDLRLVPTPAGSGDLASYLQTLPGVTTTGDRGGQLFVRGGTPAENLVLIDGIPIYQPFHILGFFSAFPEDLVSSVDFYASGFGARYSGRTSSVLDVAIREGNPNGYHVMGSASPFLAEALVEGPAGTGISWLFSARRSLVDETSEALLGSREPLDFDSQLFKVSVTDGENLRCSVLALRTSDHGQIDPERADSYISWKNLVAGGRCVTQFERVLRLLEVNFSTSSFDNAAVSRGSSMLQSRVWRMQHDMHTTSLIRSIPLYAGYHAYIELMDYDLTELFGVQREDNDILGIDGYVEAAVPIGRRIEVRPGVVLTGSPQPGLEPRLRASWEPFGRSSEKLQGAFGLYHQDLVGTSDIRDVSSTFVAWMKAPDGEVTQALHASLGWQQSLPGGVRWSTEGYYKRMKDIPVPAWQATTQFTTRLDRADGRVLGVDTRVEYTRPHFYGFVGYGYASTLYEATQPEFEVWFGDPVQRYHPPQDRRHQLNALTTLDLAGFRASARWQFGTGLPFSRPIGFDEAFDFTHELPDVDTNVGTTRMLLDRPFTGRLPTMHRLDVSLGRGFELPFGRVTAAIGAINAYDRQNMFYYDLFTGRRVDQLPLAPYASVTLRSR